MNIIISQGNRCFVFISIQFGFIKKRNISRITALFRIKRIKNGKANICIASRTCLHRPMQTDEIPYAYICLPPSI